MERGAEGRPRERREPDWVGLVVRAGRAAGWAEATERVLDEMREAERKRAEREGAALAKARACGC